MTPLHCQLCPRPWGHRFGRWAALIICLGVVQTALALDLQGHRGARGLAPENTLAGFRTAMTVGVTTLELDLGVSADGQVVVAHDPELNPNFTRDAQGRWLQAAGPALHSLTLAELQRYDVGRLKPGTRYAGLYPEQQPVDGERIPTLDAVFAMVAQAGKDRLRFNLETKISPLSPGLTPAPDVFVRAVLAVIDKHGLRSRVTLQSFDWRTLRVAQKLAPDLATVALTARLPSINNLDDERWTAGLRLHDHAGSVAQLVKAAGVGTWSPFHGELTEALLAEAHALGLKVVPWTVNDPAQMQRLLAWGVDGLITDRPDLARKAMAARGMPLP